MQNDNLFSDALDFLQDVAAHDDGSPHASQFTNHVHDGRSSKGVAALQWFVKNDQFRVVDNGVSNFSSLPHAFRVLTNLLVSDISESDKVQHTVSLKHRFCSCQSIQSGKCGYKLVGGHPVIHLFMLRYEADSCVWCRILPRVSAEQANLSLAWFEFAHQEFEHCRLSGTVHSEYASDTTIERHCDV